jgi:hypothetical protein
MAVAVVQSGNYDLQIATGFQVNAFTLDDATRGVLNNTEYVLDGLGEFASVLDGALNVNVRRGRRDQGDTFGAGTMTFTLDDTLAGGVFNPFNTDSPFYDTAQALPGLAPMREVRLLRYDSTNTPQFIFNGYIVNYDYNFALGGNDTVEVYCADQFYLLSQTVLDELNVTAETSGERIETVLNLPEVDFPIAARNIATGTVNLGHAAAYTVPAGTNALSYLSQINDTAEFGRLFMSRAGVLTFQNRIGNTLAGSSADFHDDGAPGTLKFTGVGISFEADQVINRAVITALDDKTATAVDAASIATYFIQTTNIGNSLLHEQTAIDDAADYLLNGQPEARYTSVETTFTVLTSAQRDTVATLEIGDTITIEKTFTTGLTTSELAQELAIEGIEHRLNFATGHSVLISTSPTVIVYEFILDDAIYGIIGITDPQPVLG